MPGRSASVSLLLVLKHVGPVPLLQSTEPAVTATTHCSKLPAGGGHSTWPPVLPFSPCTVPLRIPHENGVCPAGTLLPHADESCMMFSSSMRPAKLHAITSQASPHCPATVPVQSACICSFNTLDLRPARDISRQHYISGPGPAAGGPFGGRKKKCSSRRCKKNGLKERRWNRSFGSQIGLWG
jgi:hypothetical protein